MLYTIKNMKIKSRALESAKWLTTQEKQYYQLFLIGTGKVIQQLKIILRISCQCVFYILYHQKVL